MLYKENDTELINISDLKDGLRKIINLVLILHIDSIKILLNSVNRRDKFLYYFNRTTINRLKVKCKQKLSFAYLRYIYIIISMHFLLYISYDF